MIGETLGSYKVLAKIGEGGMGAVYLAEQPLIGRRVAIKVLLPELSANPSALDRFFNEARATARLRHPALVDVFDFGVHQPTGAPTSSWSCSRVRAWARCSVGWDACRPRTPSDYAPADRAGRWASRTARASSTAISSPTTSSWSPDPLAPDRGW